MININILTQIQVDNSICHITEDITLTQDIVLGANTVLYFEGGKFVGQYVVTGDSTSIVAPPIQIFDGVSLNGTWNVHDCYTEWWGAIGNGTTDDSDAIRAAIDSPFEKVLLLNKKYAVSKSINVSSRKAIEGVRQSNDHDGTPQIFALPNWGTSTENFILGISSPFVTLRNFSIVKDIRNTNVAFGVYTTTNDFYRLVLEGLAVTRCPIAYKLRLFLSTIDRCTATGANIGFNILGGTSLTMTNCYVKGYHNHAYQIEGMTYSSLINCCADTLENSSTPTDWKDWFVYYVKNSNSMNFISCGAEDSAHGVLLSNCSNVSFRNCWFDLPLMTSTSQDGRIVNVLNSSRIEFDGLFISNWECTGWTYNAQYPGWLHETKLFMIQASNGSRNSVRFHNIFFKGYDRDSTLSGAEGVNQMMASRIVGQYFTNNSSSDIQIEYDWNRSGITANRPVGLDSLVGKGWTYFNSTTSHLEVWNGTQWQQV